MGIREKLNENPVITTLVTIVIIVAAGAFIVYRSVGHKIPTEPKLPTKAFYSDDDGATWFIDDASNVPPYDHNGKQAVRAVLYRCGKEKPFVQRLESYDESDRQKILEQIKSGANPALAQSMFAVDGVMVKKPGSSEWIRLKSGDTQASKAWAELMNPPACPDGKTSPLPVLPEEGVSP